MITISVPIFLIGMAVLILIWVLVPDWNGYNKGWEDAMEYQEHQLKKKVTDWDIVDYKNQRVEFNEYKRNKNITKK